MGRNRRNSRHFVFVAADIVRLLALIGLGLAIAVVILVVAAVVAVGAPAGPAAGLPARSTGSCRFS